MYSPPIDSFIPLYAMLYIKSSVYFLLLSISSNELDPFLFLEPTTENFATFAFTEIYLEYLQH
jgi:hypothetical protein